MRKILLPVYLIFICSVLQAQLKDPKAQEALMAGKLSSVVKWYTIEQAEQLNKVAPRKIMIDVFTDWCGWCKKMDAATFNNPVIAKYLNTYFYPVKFDAEQMDTIFFLGQKYFNENQGNKPTHQLAVALLKGQMSYPSIAYFTEKWEYMGAMPGYKTAQQYEVILNYIATDKYKTEKMEDFSAKFVGELNPPPPPPPAPSAPENK